MPKKAEIIHINREELARFAPPAATASHKPIAYDRMAGKLIEVADSMIVPYGYRLHSEKYEVRDDGSQMFGTITWSNGDVTDMGFTIGIRNSYDKSIAAGLACGGTVFVCSNMMFNGDIVVMRKNTTNGLSDFEKSAVVSMYDSRSVYESLVRRMNAYKELPLSSNAVYSMFGEAFCEKVLKPQQLTAAKRHWDNPEHEEFRGNTVFNLYQAMNTPLKACSPRDILEAHKALDSLFAKKFNHIDI